MKKYPEYKESGIKWLIDIPNHWLIKRADTVFKLKKNLIKQNEINGSTVFHYSIPSVQESGTGKEEEGNSIDSDKFIVDGNELLISKLNPRKETICITEEKNLLCISSTEFLVLDPIAININFGFYLLKSHVTKERISSTVQSATKSHQRANPSDIYKMWIQYPPFNEQTTIANFLDQKTQLIDDLITKKERLIELLQEERTAIINQAVTRGLDPNVPMKDSGIEWLGKIPEHWGVKRLKFLVNDHLKYGANESAEDENHDHPRYIRITDFDGSGNLRENTFKSLKPEVAEEFLLEEGDVLFARSGATVGKTFIFKNFNGKACFAGYLIKASPKQNMIESDFLYYVTLSNYYQNWKNSIFIQATIQNIGADKYQNLLIPTPPIDEQKMLLDKITDNTNRIGLMLEHLKDEINLFNEYKISLINEAVTGKIDVRDYKLNHATN